MWRARAWRYEPRPGINGILPVEFGSKAARLFRERQIGDYEFDVSVTQPDAVQDIEIAAEMVAAIEQLLR